MYLNSPILHYSYGSLFGLVEGFNERYGGLKLKNWGKLFETIQSFLNFAIELKISY